MQKAAPIVFWISPFEEALENEEGTCGSLPNLTQTLKPL